MSSRVRKNYRRAEQPDAQNTVMVRRSPAQPESDKDTAADCPLPFLACRLTCLERMGVTPPQGTAQPALPSVSAEIAPFMQLSCNCHAI